MADRPYVLLSCCVSIDGYLGEHYSHAAAMRRVLDHEGVTVVGVGIRAISGEKTGFAYADEMILPSLLQASGAARAIARGARRPS